MSDLEYHVLLALAAGPLYGYAVYDMRFSWMLGLGALFGRQPPETRFQGFEPRFTRWTEEFERFRAANPQGVTFAIDSDAVGAFEELVAGADLFARPRAEPAPSRSADIYSYTLTVQVGRRRRTLRLHDPIDEPALQALLSYLEELRASGAGSGAA